MFNMLQIPIIMPVSSGPSGPWTNDDTKLCIAIYLAFAILWLLYALYYTIFKKISFIEAITTNLDGDIVLLIINGVFYILTGLFLLILTVIGIYNFL